MDVMIVERNSNKWQHEQTKVFTCALNLKKEMSSEFMHYCKTLNITGNPYVQKILDKYAGLMNK